MQGSGGLILSMRTLVKHRRASQTEQKPGPALGRNPLIPPPTSHIAFCAWPICPAARSTGAILWRQAGQILFALDALDRRKPQDRRFRVGSRNEPPPYERDEC